MQDKVNGARDGPSRKMVARTTMQLLGPSLRKHHHMRTLCLFILATGATANAQTTDGLFGHWPLNQNYNDASPNGMHGAGFSTQDSPTTDRNGNEGCAVWIEEGGFDVPASPLLQTLPDSGLTLSAWVRRDAQYAYATLVVRNSSSINDVLLSVSDQRLAFRNSQVALIVDTPQIVLDNDWHHFAGVYDDHQWTLYYDAAIVQQTVSPNGISTGGTPQFTTFASGAAIDDIRVYRRALDQAEIGTLFEEQGDCSIAAAVAEGSFQPAVCGPNPTTGRLDIRFLAPMPSATPIRVFDPTGKMVERSFVNGMQAMVDLSGYPCGVYALRIGDGEAAQTLRVVKE
jgi:hypothetical protein